MFAQYKRAYYHNNFNHSRRFSMFIKRFLSVAAIAVLIIFVLAISLTTLSAEPTQSNETPKAGQLPQGAAPLVDNANTPPSQADTVQPTTQNAPPEASTNGKYSNLIQILNCPHDKEQYGEFNDYGYWGGGDWCGQVGKAGYWVWINPNWYVWQNQQ
jgi:hypothetical protein